MKRLLAALLIVSLVATACMGGDGEDADPTASAAGSGGVSTATGTDASSTESVSATATSAVASVGEMSPAEVFAQVGQALVRDGEVFHTTITVTSTAGEAYPDHEGETGELWTDEVWVDAGENAARRTFRRAPGNDADLTDEMTVLFVDGTAYFEDDGEIAAEEWRAFCPPGEPPELVAYLLETSCEAFGPAAETEESQLVTARVEPNAEFDGQPAIAIVYEITVQPAGAPSPTPFGPPASTPVPNVNPQRAISSFYVDSETLLPLAWEIQSYDHSNQEMLRLLATFDNEFVPASDLEAGFFDPAAFGYVAIDPLAALDDPTLDVTVYWLGERFEPGGDLPAVEIYEALGPRPAGGGPGDQVMIEYQPVGVDGTSFGFYLQLLTPDTWESQGSKLGSDLWQNPCVETEEIEVDGGTATIYQTYEPAADGSLPASADACPDGAHNRFMTIVDYGDTMLTINAPLTLQASGRGNESASDPYDSLEGMRAIVDGLHPFSRADSEQAGTDKLPMIEDVYAGLAATLEDRDGILYSTQTMTGGAAGLVNLRVTFQTWVDAREPVARLEFEGEYTSMEEGKTLSGTSHVIIRDGSEYSTSEGEVGQDEPRAVEAEGCYGQPEAIAVVIGCPGPTETSTTSVEWGTQDGQPVLVLVTAGETRGSDEVTSFLRRVYVDPDTFLPLFSEEEGVFDTGDGVLEFIVFEYEHEFVKRSALPEDFFELTAIGYTAPDYDAQIDEYFDTPVYWLGEAFAPGGSLPTLTLSGVQDDYSSPANFPNYDGFIYYAQADNQHGPPVLALEIWLADEWFREDGGSITLDALTSWPCNAHESLAAPEGSTATLYWWVEQDFGPDAVVPEGSPGCDVPGSVRYTAIVEFPDTVVVIDAAGSSSPRDSYQPSPYNSAEGMRAVVEGLERR